MIVETDSEAHAPWILPLLRIRGASTKSLSQSVTVRTSLCGSCDTRDIKPIHARHAPPLAFDIPSHRQMCGLRFDFKTGCLSPPNALLFSLTFCVMYGHSWPPFPFPLPHKQLIALLCSVAHFPIHVPDECSQPTLFSGSWLIDWLIYWWGQSLDNLTCLPVHTVRSPSVGSQSQWAGRHKAFFPFI